jgi:4a-hydroxytetrahydrobiopterin dehydratase|tara:strand:+ start:1771 stop:2052 length:282 start_codon:yes stop_codon:yes gene_type:complete
MDYFCGYDSNDLAILIMEWTSNNNILSKTFEFHSYLDGIDFVNTIANIAEQVDHHPDISIGYCRVTISLTTHDSGGLTDKDYKFAKIIDDLGL